MQIPVQLSGQDGVSSVAIQFNSDYVAPKPEHPEILNSTNTHNMINESNSEQAITNDNSSVQSISINLSQNFDQYAPPSLQHIPTDTQHPAYVPSVQNLVLFSSYRVPNRKDVAQNSHLPFGLMFSPVAPVEPTFPCLRKPPVKCIQCSAIINRYCKIDLSSGTWTCVFCRARNEHKEEYGDNSPSSSFPELIKMGVEFLDPTQQPFPISSGYLDPAYIFVIDLNISHSELEHLKNSILKVLAQLPTTVRIGILTFHSIVSVYETTLSGLASAEMLPGILSPSINDLTQILDRTERYVAPMSETLENLATIMDAFISSIPPRTKSTPCPRALGSAVEVAMALLGAADGYKKELRPLLGRVVVFTNGTPNYGPGCIPENNNQDHAEEYMHVQATNYFKNLSLRAHEHDIGVDIFCIGLKQFNSKILQHLVLNCGGSVIMQKDFTSSDFSRNLLLALHRTCGRQGVVEFRTSPSIAITHVIGPAVPHATKSEVVDTATNYCSMRMAGVQPRLAYSVLYDLVEDILGDFIYFQFTVKFTNLENQCVLRVITRKLPTTGNTSNFLASADADVMAILTAKKLVLKTRKSDNLDDITNELDNSVYRIITQCGTREKRYYKLPAELSPLPKKLFLLRRGPLMGVILQHSDDIDHLRCLFLHANFEDSKRIIDPPLLMALEPDDAFKEQFFQIPLEDLALQSDKVLLLDHHTDLFVWSGKEVLGSAYDYKRQNSLKYAQQSIQHRFPQPQILQFKEGASMARWLQCRLIPAHKDSPEEQLSSFPQLEELTIDARKKLLTKFHRTDDLSYHQYYRSLFKS